MNLRKMKQWAIYTNLPVNDIVKPLHPWSGDKKRQERYLSPSAEKQSPNYDTESSSHYPILSTVTPKWLNCSKMKWWAIYPKLLVNYIDRPPNTLSGDSQDQETFWAHPLGKQTRIYDTACSNHHLSINSKAKGIGRWNGQLYTKTYQ